MSNMELTEEEQKLVGEGIDVIPVRIKVYLGKFFNKIHKYECINLDTNQVFLLQTVDTGLGFEADKCYTIPILKSDKEFKNLVDSRTMDGKFLELIYPIDEETKGLVDPEIKGIGRPLDMIPEFKVTDNYEDARTAVFTIPKPDIITASTIEAEKEIVDFEHKLEPVRKAIKKVVEIANDKPSLTERQSTMTSDHGLRNREGSQFDVSRDKLELNLESIRILNPKATEQNALKFLQKCIWQNLNPFIGDCYLITYENSQTKEQDMSMVVSKDVFLKRSALEPKYEGFEAGIIVKVGDVLESRQGAMYIKGDETLIGGWAKVFVKGLKPFFAEVLVSEYTTSKSLWNSKPATMIRKVALSQAMREAFPAQFQGMYEESELDVEENKK